MISLRYFIVSCLWHTSLFREVASFYFGHLIILYVLALVQYVTIDPFLLLRTRTSNHLGTCEFKLYNWGGVWLGGVHTNKSREVRTEYTRNFVFVYLSSVSCESLVLAQNEFCFEKVCSYLALVLESFVQAVWQLQRIKVLILVIALRNTVVNSIAGLKVRPFSLRPVPERRDIVQLGPHKPKIVIEYDTRTGKKTTVVHDPDSALPKGNSNYY